jgi:hypothetical protein
MATASARRTALNKCFRKSKAPRSCPSRSPPAGRDLRNFFVSLHSLDTHPVHEKHFANQLAWRELSTVFITAFSPDSAHRAKKRQVPGRALAGRLGLDFPSRSRLPGGTPLPISSIHLLPTDLPESAKILEKPPKARPFLGSLL